MLKKQLALALIAIFTFMMAMPVSAQGPALQNRAPGGMTVPVALTLNDTTQTTGTLTVKRFVTSGTNILAEGVLSFTNGAETVVTNVSVPVRLPTAGATGITIQQAVCEVLDLTLGPLDLNLAGLEVHLDTVHLLITADPTGGLLGSLLAGLLCGSGGLSGLLGDIATNLQAIVNILNQIIALLG